MWPHIYFHYKLIITIKPYFSILVTVFNREEFISSSIESVLSQTFTNFELIILDDCSFDSSYKIAHELSLNDSRIKIIRNSVNIGQFLNRNKIAQYAKGEILIYLDSDDTFNSDALEYIYDSIQQFRHISFGMVCHDLDDSTIKVMKSKDAIHYHFFNRSILHIGPSGTFIKRDLFDKIGGFPNVYGPVCDLYYNICATCHTDILLLSYNYLNYRIHPGQEINNKKGYLSNSYLYFNDIMKIQKIPLEVTEIDFLLKKNKRRFVVNCVKYLLDSADVITVIKAIRLVKFTSKDFLTALFQ